MLAASLGDFLWSLLIIFFMVIYFMILFQVIFDLFGRHDTSGWAKAAWVIFIILAPFLGLLVYLIVNGHGMAERRMKGAVEQQQQFDSYVKSVASQGDPAEQIAKAKQLLDAGTISQAEFDQLKSKALAG